MIRNKITILFLLFSLILSPTFSLGSDNPKSVDVVYKLGSGDKLKITVFNEPDLSGEFEVDGSGILSMPLVGNIPAGGLDIRTLEANVVDSLKNGYLLNPRVSIEIMNFRPFFILGEVNDPGSYPYVNGLTVINAVALAGGFTHRARTDRVMVTRVVGDKKSEFEAKDGDIVMPGDSIRITERFF